MAKAKAILMGLAMTAVSIVVIFWAVKQFAPATVKPLFQVS